MANLLGSSVFRLIRRFSRHERGSILPMFALVGIPLFLAGGALLDYSMAAREYTRLNAFADAAALSAVDQTSLALTPAQAQTLAQNVFSSQAASLSGVTVSNLNVTITTSNLTRTALVTYQATRQAPFAAIFGLSNMTINGQATAVSTASSYINFYLLLDNTPSMGVGATTADINTMVNNTPDQCAFACHDLTNPNSYYNLAKQLGVTMRIDVVRQATQQLTQTATSIAQYPNQYQMAVYTFGASASTAGLTTVAALSSNMTSVSNATANIDLMTVEGQNQYNDQDTNYDSVLTAMNNIIPNPGPGTQAAPQEVLFFVTDGVADEQNTTCSEPLDGQRCQEPINVSLCTTLKNRGVLIAVLYTTYLPLPTNAWYNTWIAPFSSTIATKMQACASPGLFFQVSPSDGIAEAMNALFQQAVNVARLSK
ncbi:MAG TPA: pilus assembly protein TadG-related protein [Xanthobacteraceae bacterium]|nr:pilus assembly protein TadG-related protein [Xanthobacteraceae bacterium]